MRDASPQESSHSSTIDIKHETLLTVRDVPGRLPRKPSGKRLHISAVYRWMSNGVGGGVRLESVKLGGTTYTSVEALQRFAERRRGRDAEGPPLMSRRRQDAIDAAATESDRILNRY